MITEIGVTAGEIWNTLETSGELSIDALEQCLQRDSEVLLMAVGWLCREGYCNAVIKDGGVIVSLRQEVDTKQNQ